MSELYISVDGETDGPIPGPFSLVSFGASLAGIRHLDGSIEHLDQDDPANQFYAEMHPISDEWEPEALAVSGLTREHLLANGRAPEEVMVEFAEWVTTRRTELCVKGVVFAAYPLGFDWMFLYWYLIKFARNSPFGHSRHIDMKSYYAAKANVAITQSVKARMPKRLLSKRKHTHNGLDDAIEQGELLLNLLEWDGKR